MSIRLSKFAVCTVICALMTLGASIVRGQYTADITIGEALSQDENYSILVRALDTTGLLDDLKDPEKQFTLFAENDDLIETALKNANMTVEDLFANTESLGQSLRYLIIEREVPVNDLATESELQTMSGNTLLVNTDDTGTWLNGQVRVTDANFTGSNGVIYVIDNILVPPASDCTVSAQSRTSTRVRVGPGKNRTAVAFLPTGTEFIAQGKAEDQDGESWYQLDKTLAAPRAIILEAWVAAGEVTISGDCDRVGEVPPPPLIPFPTETPAS